MAHSGMLVTKTDTVYAPIYKNANNLYVVNTVYCNISAKQKNSNNANLF